MAILPICTKCDRLNGYANSQADTICARCKKITIKKPEVKKGDKGWQEPEDND